MSSKIKHIVILETSDIHGNVFPINYLDNSKEQFGLTKLSSIVKDERKKNDDLILIDNGDIIQGTPLTYYYAKVSKNGNNPIISILNYMKYNAAVIGNHEFNYGTKILNDSVNQSNFPWLSANIVDKKSKKPAFGVPYITKQIDTDLKLAVLGLTTKFIPNWENPNIIKEFEFLDVVETAQKWINMLKREKKVDIIIVSYHGGFERDIDTGYGTEIQNGENQAYELCKKVTGMDVLLTGHQHRKIWGKAINGVTVVQPGYGAKNIGKVDIVLEKTSLGWKIVKKESSLLPTLNVKDDSEVIEIGKKFEEDTQKWLDTPIGKVKGDMTIKDPKEARLRDNALIEFINKIQMINGNVDISATALFDNNGKGFPANVTMRDIVSNYVYPNTLKVIRVKGKDIKDALEVSAAYFETFTGKVKVSSKFTVLKPHHYNYDMWEGIEYEINISRKIGDRITKLNYRGAPMEMDKEYDIAVNNYRASGGGNYDMFKNKRVIKDIPIDISELIADYFLKNGEVTAKVNGNWKVVHD
ncbi:MULTISPECIES: bifunctional metallophosphatase/5'-nucleotidase [Clostridium]|uniref:bifunctional metallophosphatase/5'-nucleotidase n=1 Tax=Clostridium TaxID=1485 RepID=UPI0008240579|nr:MULTISPECIES: bifunctional UDP-sugar hydrolase/5'-nucleotidase [Clostridium]PJI10105.1 bifunctional metallophosphatase/5'-nucleotidase [Clostridium sp. CT7]